MAADLIPPESLDTGRVRIRCYRPDDGPALSAAVNSSYAHLRPWMPWATPCQSVAQSTRLVRTFRARWLLAEDFVLGIWTPDESQLLGGTGFHLRHGPLELGVAEIGMWIRGEQAGQGLGTHVLEALVGWGFSAWPWRRLVWKCDTGNVASRRTAEKAGLVLEGVQRLDARTVDGRLRDTACYAVVKEA